MEQTVQERKVHIIPAEKPSNTSAGQRQEGKRVAAYCRVSTNSEEQINSYEAQKEYYTKLIEEKPEWEMAGVFADKGLSGTSMKKRDEFNRMIRACKRGKIDMILTKSLSRFARNTVDCLETVRMLKANGIGVIFEKENINTLTESSEFLITLFSGFAQAESESLSKNITWGKQKSAEAGNVSFQYKKLLGYRKGADGKPEIVPEEAEIVRRIYRRYLEGASLCEISRELDRDGVRTAEGVKTWSNQVVKNILSNEKYIGDALLLKTYTKDCISKKVIKNTDRPMVYVEGSHPAIISRDVFKRAQEEMARRTSKRKVMQKTAKTEQGKYSAKYALTELLVCGECGSPYKRVTWARNGKKRIVWRCVSRLEYGTKYCHASPTLDEQSLHTVIVETLNECAGNQKEVIESAYEIAKMVKSGGKTGNKSIPALRQRLDALIAEQASLLDEVLENMDDPTLNARLKALKEEKQEIADQIKQIEAAESHSENQASRLDELKEWLDKQSARIKEYDDTLARKLIERITVVNAETVKIKLRNTDIEITQEVC